MKNSPPVQHTSARRRSRSIQPANSRRLLRLEGLEERCAPATLTVMNLNDSGAGSLRQAIQQAKMDGPTDTIVFNSGLTGTITLTSGELAITQPMIIQGPGASVLTINGNNASRIFNTTGASTVSISGLTLSNANAGANPGGAIFDPSGGLTLSNMVLNGNKASNQGGAVFVGSGGALTLQASTLSSNMALGMSGNGGAVYVAGGGSAVVQDSTLRGNSAAVSGGGLFLFNGSNLTVQRSTLSGNITSGDNTGGGGLAFSGSGTLMIQNSTISSNTVDGVNVSGAGLLLTAFTGSATIQNSTFSANSAGTNGGGIRFQSGSGALIIENSTIAQNIAEFDNDDSGTGGGLSVDPTVTGTTQLISSIVAGNIDRFLPGAPDIGGTVQASFSLVQNTTGAMLGTSSTNVTGQDPHLGPLQNNGGPTLTQAISAGSPALEIGSNVAGLANDQRGAPYPRTRGSTTDAGAFELFISSGAPTATFVPVMTPRTTPAGVVTVNFSAPVVGVTLAAFSLTRDGTNVPLTGLSVTQVTPSQYAIDLTSVTATPGSYVLTLTAAGSGIKDLGGTALAGNASLTFQVTTPTPPTATFVPVTTPRTTSAGVVTVNFSAAVTGVTITPFSLTRNGTNVPLTGLSVTQVMPSRYTIDLTTVTAAAGNYVFTLTAAGSGIKDASSNPLAANASISFQVTPTTPTAVISPVATPRTDRVALVTITFSTPVTGVTITPFSLTSDGTNVPLTGLTVAQVTPSQYTINLNSVTGMPGNYVFKLTAAGSGIQSASSTPLAADASISFRVTNPPPVDSVYESGVYDPVSSTFYLRDEKNSGPPDSGTFTYGMPGWEPVAGDFTGSKKTTFGIVDPSASRDTVNHRDAVWFLGSAAGVNDIPAFAYGFASWTPLTGDWTGSGKFGIGAYDPTTARFYLRNETSAGAADAGVFQFGAPGWIPLAGDWTGSGKFGIGVFDPTTATFYLRNELSAGAPDAGVIQFGLPFWKPVVGDWSGNGMWTIGVVDPSGARDTVNHRDAYWFLSNDNKTVSYTPFAYGAAAWTPVVGDWNFPLSTPGAAKDRSGSPSLTDDQLQATVTTALDQLRDANVAVSLLDRLSRVQFGVRVLNGGLLSQIDPTSQQVTVDATAAGHGWSVDGTAGQDGRIDLLEVVFADLGHVTRQDGVDAVTLDSLASTSHQGSLGADFQEGM
jgi:hypothetical protein